MNKLDQCLYFIAGSVRILWMLTGMILICRLIWSGWEPMLWVAWAEVIGLCLMIGWIVIEAIGFFDYVIRGKEV